MLDPHLFSIPANEAVRLYEPATVQGIVTRKVVRCPSVLVTPIVPPCASTTSRQSVSPRPVLLWVAGCSALKRPNFSNIRSK